MLRFLQERLEELLRNSQKKTPVRFLEKKYLSNSSSSFLRNLGFLLELTLLFFADLLIYCQQYELLNRPPISMDNQQRWSEIQQNFAEYSAIKIYGCFVLEDLSM